MRDDTYIAKDKKIVPFLLTAEGVKFLGIQADRGIVYFKFSPASTCERLVRRFFSRKAPTVQPLDLLQAVETFKDYVYRVKDRRDGNGRGVS